MSSANPICPVCGSPDWASLWEGPEAFGVDRCSGCGLAVTRPFPDSAQLAAMYSTTTYRADAHRFLAPIEQLIRRFRQARLDLVRQYVRGGRLLDIGSARGLMLAMAAEQGWESYGLELNDDTARSARSQRGVDVRTGDIRDAGFEAGFFDAITIWHVLEHLTDPAAVIDECRRILRPGGVLVISVPNLDSWQARRTGARWFHLDVPYHLWHFSGETLRRLVRSRGVSVIREDHFSIEYGPYGVLQSLLNLMLGHNNDLYDGLKTGAIRRMAGWRFWASVSMLPILGPVAVAWAATESLFRRGGSITLVARKETGE